MNNNIHVANQMTMDIDKENQDAASNIINNCKQAYVLSKSCSDITDDFASIINNSINNQELSNSSEVKDNNLDIMENFTLKDDGSHTVNNNNEIKNNLETNNDEVVCKEARDSKSNMMENNEYIEEKDISTGSMYHWNEKKISNLQNICDLNMRINGNQNIHHKTEDDRIDKKYKCSICTKSYKAKHELSEHFKTHDSFLKYIKNCFVKLDKINIFKCDFCSAAYTNEESLKIHKRKYFRKDVPIRQYGENHDAKKPLHCKTCGWSFMQQSTLDKHSVLHQPFPHVCECGVGYYRLCDLQSHRALLKHVPPERVYKREETPPPSVSSDHSSESEQGSVGRSNGTVGPRLRAALVYKHTKTERKVTGKTKAKHDKRNGPTDKAKKIGVTKCIECMENDERILVTANEEGHFECPRCPKTIRSAPAFKTHMKSAHRWSFAFERRCDVCGLELQSASRLREHLAAHVGVRLHECLVCHKRYSQPGTLRLHVSAVHERVRPFPCDLCPKRFPSRGSMQNHRRTHTGEKPYECGVCGKRFSDPSACQRHKLIHTGLKPYRCELCPKAYCDPGALFRHRRVHAGHRERCDRCPREFASLLSLRRHARIAHGVGRDDPAFECDLCGRTFAFKSYLFSHMVSVHGAGGGSVARCPLCSKASSSRANLAVHIRAVHLADKRHECRVCGSRWVSASALALHARRVHSERSRDFECDHCHATFREKVNLARHMAYMHLGHHCAACSKFFSTSARLRRHVRAGCLRCPLCNGCFATPSELRQHHAARHQAPHERMLECDHCAKRFASRGALINHLQGHDRSSPRFHCEHCGAAFRRRSQIVHHIRFKHDIVLYCDRCLRGYHSERDLARHKRRCAPRAVRCEICEVTVPEAKLKEHLVKHGPMRAECHYCARKFRRKDQLPRHFRLKHKLKV